MPGRVTARNSGASRWLARTTRATAQTARIAGTQSPTSLRTTAALPCPSAIRKSTITPAKVCDLADLLPGEILLGGGEGGVVRAHAIAPQVGEFVLHFEFVQSLVSHRFRVLSCALRITFRSMNSCTGSQASAHAAKVGTAPPPKDG